MIIEIDNDTLAIIQNKKIFNLKVIEFGTNQNQNQKNR
jgi:hypothetical protein